MSGRVVYCLAAFVLLHLAIASVDLESKKIVKEFPPRNLDNSGEEINEDMVTLSVLLITLLVIFKHFCLIAFGISMLSGICACL